MDRRTIYVDCDDTLLMHDLSEYPERAQVAVRCRDREFTGVPNQKSINTLLKFYRLGYEIIVWSKTGKTWAEAVVKALDIWSYVDSCQTKPDFYMDDKDVGEWIGPRIWRDAK